MDKKNLAKKILISDLYKGRLRRVGNLLSGRCPFHQDGTPSFRIYLQTNSWYCFAGCGGGDNISFYMKLHRVDFKTALEELSK